MAQYYVLQVAGIKTIGLYLGQETYDTKVYYMFKSPKTIFVQKEFRHLIDKSACTIYCKDYAIVQLEKEAVLLMRPLNAILQLSIKKFKEKLMKTKTFLLWFFYNFNLNNDVNKLILHNLYKK